jgi:transcriptional regulator with XRE-family HTH domain
LSQEDDDQDRRRDRHVGERVRRRRKAMGQSQAELGRTLGFSGQQIQTYGRGSNQLTTAKLWALAEALGVSIDDFFQGMGENRVRPVSLLGTEDDRLQTFLACADADDWIRAAGVLQSPLLRRKLLQLIEALTAED